MNKISNIFFLGLLYAILLVTPHLFAQHACDSVYTTVEEMPTFQENGIEFSSFLSGNLNISKDCYQDAVYVFSWTIDMTGNMIDILAPGMNAACANKVIDQFKKFPAWTPGKSKGKPVCVKMFVRMCIKTG